NDMLGLNGSEKPQRIDFICADFYILHKLLKNKDEIFNSFKKSLFEELIENFFTILRANSNVQIYIHTLGVISEEMDIKDLQKDKMGYILETPKAEPIKESEANGIRGIKIITYKPNNIFINFLSALQKHFKDTKDIQTISDLLKALSDENLTSKDLKAQNAKEPLIQILQEHKNSIKKEIQAIRENKLFDTLIKNKLEESLEQNFKGLLEQINKFGKSLDDEKHKMITNAIMGALIPIFMGGFVSISVGFSIISLALSLKQIEQKGNDVFIGPLLEFLVGEFGMFANHINTKLLSSALIVEKNDKKHLLDLSCFTLGMSENLHFLSLNLAYEANCDMNFDTDQFFQQVQDKTNSGEAKEEKKQSFKLNSKFKLNYEEQKSLKNYAEEQVKKFNHFAYIESPHFNSSDLAEIFSNKENKTASSMGKNYLLITNFPNKYNAKLTELLTNQIVGNKIIDQYRKKEPSFNFNPNQSTYNSARDYSNFKINVEDEDDKPYVLQLSLFQKIAKKEYEKEKEEIEEFENEREELLDLARRADFFKTTPDAYGYPEYKTILDLYRDKERDICDEFSNKEFSLPYISSHFKQAKDKEDIILNEKEAIKEYLSLIETFLFENIHQPKAKARSTTYSILECFIIAYALYHIAQKFPSVHLQMSLGYNVNHKIDFNQENLECKDYPLSEEQRDNQSIKPENIIDWELYQHIEYDNAKFCIYLYNFTLTHTKEKSDIFIQKLLNSFLQGTTSTSQSLYERLKKDLNQPLESFFLFEENGDFETKFKKLDYENLEEQIKQLQDKNLEELLKISFFKVLASAFPFMNFFIDNELKNYEHAFKIFTTLLTQGLDEVFLNELGFFHLAKQKIRPDKTFVKISIDDEVLKDKEKLKKYSQFFLKADLIHTQKQKEIFEKKQALITNKLDSIATLEKISPNLAKAKLINELYAKNEIKIGGEKLTKDDVRLLKNMFFYHNDTTNHQRAGIGYIQLQSILAKAKSFHKTKMIAQFRANLAEAITSAGLDLILESIFPSHYEAIKRSHKLAIHKFYTFKYDAPLAVEKEDFVYYPMRINSKMMSFDFKDIIYGLELRTGVFVSHLSLMYNLYYEHSRENQEFALRRLLSYLIIDEKRGVSSKDEMKEPKDFISDKEFFSKAYKNIEIHHCTIYQLETTSALYKEFRRRERRNKFKDDRAAPIRLYNEALAILEDYANHYFTNTLIEGQYLFDKRKARRLIKALDIIGQNNLKAVYVKEKNEGEKVEKNIASDTLNKTNNKTDSKDEPTIPTKAIGRLATTIIIEDGLYLG
ncbi:hypothetical protein, partial [Campylobacter helveticus]|uniref:hypothetical protein n=1 Tax=Campylobacter helveticus TaxID=28898 RepID=UPI002149B02A